MRAQATKGDVSKIKRPARVLTVGGPAFMKRKRGIEGILGGANKTPREDADSGTTNVYSTKTILGKSEGGGRHGKCSHALWEYF